jgi:hypothetical protein
MLLSAELVLVYILEDSRVSGRLTAGRIESDASGKLVVFDKPGERFEYLSADRLGSWCVIDGMGEPVDGPLPDAGLCQVPQIRGYSPSALAQGLERSRAILSYKRAWQPHISARSN